MGPHAFQHNLYTSNIAVPKLAMRYLGACSTLTRIPLSVLNFQGNLSDTWHLSGTYELLPEGSSVLRLHLALFL